MPSPPRRHVSLDPGSLKGKQPPQAGPLWVSLQQSEVRRPPRASQPPQGLQSAPGCQVCWPGWSPGGGVTLAQPGKVWGMGAVGSPALPGPARPGAGEKFLPGLLGFTALVDGHGERAGLTAPPPIPCQIVLNYNDKRWQASTATSQNMTNTPVSEPSSPLPRRGRCC